MMRETDDRPNEYPKTLERGQSGPGPSPDGGGPLWAVGGVFYRHILVRALKSAYDSVGDDSKMLSSGQQIT